MAFTRTNTIRDRIPIKQKDRLYSGERRIMDQYWDKEKWEKAQQKMEQETFNSGSNSVKPRNQNQEHNVRKEATMRKDFN